MKNKLIALFVLLVSILVAASACSSGNTNPPPEPVVLDYWRVFDGRDDFAEIITKYNEMYPHVTINYRTFRYDEYEEAILHALAEDRGPDIFSIHNSWTREYKSKLEPLPAQTSMVVPVTQGSIKKEVVFERRSFPSLTIRDLKQSFVDVVSSDVVLDEKIYGLPLSVDTLVMYYNQDLFDQAGVTNIPRYWNREFQQTVKSLTRQDLRGNIIQSGVALGEADNVERFSDILAVLMMQNGAQMMTDSGQVSFQSVPEGFENRDYNPGLMALRFYTDFANPIKEVYCWNANLDNSLEMFISGRLAIFFGYSYHNPLIKTRAPRLNYWTEPLPQIEGSGTPINMANYWLEVVSNKSKNKNEAWNFVQFMTSASNVGTYLDKTRKPTALRSLIAEQRDEDDLRVFVEQLLTARSWYRGSDSVLTEGFLSEMIKEVLEDDGTNTMSIMNFYANRIQQLEQ